MTSKQGKRVRKWPTLTIYERSVVDILREEGWDYKDGVITMKKERRKRG